MRCIFRHSIHSSDEEWFSEQVRGASPQGGPMCKLQAGRLAYVGAFYLFRLERIMFGSLCRFRIGLARRLLAWLVGWRVGGVFPRLLDWFRPSVKSHLHHVLRK